MRMKLITPPQMPLKSFIDPLRAWEYVCEIYDRNTGFIRDHLLNLTKGQVPPGKVRAHYPKVQVLSTSFQQQASSRLAYGFLHSPGLYQTTITQPTLFHKYLIENFSLILKNHGGEIEIGESETPIPLHFAVDPKERVEGDVLLDIGVPLRDIFDVPDLAHMDDEIANGTFIPPAGGPYPLAAFTGPRVDYSLHRLNHYMAATPEHFQNFVIFTNYQFYIEEFTRLAHQWMSEGHEFYESFVEPGNVVTMNSRLGGGTTGVAPARQSQMPAYHLKASNGRGITMINIGVGPSNAKTATDHVAVLRPHAWLMLGHCAGLRNSQSLGDYVLAHGYVREDHV